MEIDTEMSLLQTQLVQAARQIQSSNQVKPSELAVIANAMIVICSRIRSIDAQLYELRTIIASER